MAPGDKPNQACTVCHAGAAVNSFGGNVRVTFPNGLTYTPGQAQDLTVTVTDSTAAIFGFEMTARLDNSPSNAQAGSFTAATGERVICADSNVAPSGGCAVGAGLSWIEHNSPSMTGVFTVHWTPPASASGPVHIFVAANGANGDDRPTGDHIYAADYVLVPAVVSPGSAGSPTVRSIAGAAGATSSIESGSWISIFGTNFGAAAGTNWNSSISSDNVFPTTLGGVTVSINGKPAPIAFVNDTQINALAPIDASIGPVNVIVTNSTGSSTPATAQMDAQAPGFFTLDQSHIAGVVLESDGKGTILAPAGAISGATTRAAKGGETIALFGTGFGRTVTLLNPGIAQSVAYPISHTGPDNTLPTATLTIGGQPATISFIGLVSPGLYQINAVVPQVAAGEQAVVLKLLSGPSTTQTVTIPVQ